MSPTEPHCGCRFDEVGRLESAAACELHGPTPAPDERQAGLREALALALRRSILRHGDNHKATWTAVAGDGLSPDEVLAGTLAVILDVGDGRRLLHHHDYGAAIIPCSQDHGGRIVSDIVPTEEVSDGSE